MRAGWRHVQWQIISAFIAGCYMDKCWWASVIAYALILVWGAANEALVVHREGK